jgi:hypothetical protein
MSFISFGNTLQNLFSGPVYLSSESPSENLEHLAELQKDNRTRNATQKHSQELAVQGEPHPITNRTSALYEGILKGGMALVGSPLVGGFYKAAESENLLESDLRFCATFTGPGKGLKAIAEASYKSLGKAFELGAEAIADKAKCWNEPVLARVATVLTRSLEFFSEYKEPILGGAAAFGVLAMVYTYRSYVSKQKAARETLYQQLFEIYDRAAYELVSSYRQARFEQNREEMQFYQNLAEKIQNNMPKIKEDIDRCSIALTEDKREQIVSKLENAVSFVLEDV